MKWVGEPSQKSSPTILRRIEREWQSGPKRRRKTSGWGEIVKLHSKVAVITGGNSGIGLAIAREFKSNGAKVVIFGRSQGTLEQAAKTLSEDVLAVQGDVRKMQDLEHLFER